MSAGHSMPAAARPLANREPARASHLLATTTWTLFAALGCVLLVIGSKTFAMLPREATAWMTFGCLLGAAAASYAIARSAGLNPWTSSIFLLTALYFVRYGWGTLVVEYWERYPWQAHPELRWRYHRWAAWENLPLGCYLILVFGAGLFVGSVLAATRRRSGLPRFSWPVNERKFKGLLMLCGPAAAVINSLVQFALPVSMRATVALFGYIIYPSILLGSYWLFSATETHEKIRWMLFVAVTVAATVPVGLMTGQVGGLLMPGAMVVLGLIMARRGPPWKAFAIILPLAVLVILPFASEYKFQGAGARNVSQRISDTARRFATMGMRTRVELALERGVGRFAASYMPAVYARFYPDVFPYEHGRTFLIEASTVVPRLLWPGKPSMSIELNEYAVRIGMVHNGDETSAVFDAISEYYVDFGAPGMFILAIAHGYYWQALQRWLTSKVPPVIGTAVFLALLATNLDFFGFGQSFVNHVKFIPVWLILFYLISRQRHREAVVAGGFRPLPARYAGMTR